MQRVPRKAAVQACVREQRALSVPKKQPSGAFHPMGPNTTAAAGRDRQDRRRERRDGALRGSTERSLCYEVLCGVEPTAPQHPSVLPQEIGWEGNIS